MGTDSTGHQQLYAIGDIATITYSIHQDKNAVRTLGRIAPRGYTRGPETVAGTIIFNIFNKQALHELGNRELLGRNSIPMTSIPPFDILLYFSNEYGHQGRLGIFGVQIIDEGQTHSTEDTYIENQANYIALYVQPLDDLIINPSSAEFVVEARSSAIAGFGVNSGPFDYSYIEGSP